MKDAAPKTISLKDYTAPAFVVQNIYLTFHLHDTKTEVQSVMNIVSNQKSFETRDLILNGEELTLKSVKLNGELLDSTKYSVVGDLLTVFNVPEKFQLEIANEMDPLNNKTLDGLYKSGAIFCTQNEPEGFRRITYYIDRPDNMAKFTTKIIADKKLYPVLLSNGNLISSGDLANGEHFVVWEDPFKKPCYLYALVAGDLGVIKDTFKTMSGRTVALEIYCDKGNESKCNHAMESLKKSMKWDEERFGREYDLDIYMIVAVDAFNMGAMENKGLNIFNSAYVLADQNTATDQSFYGIESVIGHEYFHNWTGNRITCRDWFQLTLKEGLTVYRDQEFSADLNSRAVERIVSVKRLRQAQFPEDAGPTSHPIKPSSYIEINNFYTATVYEKGAEVIRMYETLLGRAGFRRGMDKYFELFDEQAVRTEDFMHAMSVANNNYDFTQFKRWYDYSGTPHVNVESTWNENTKSLTLKISQSGTKEPLHIPLSFGLLDKNGNDLNVGTKLLELKTKAEAFEFKNLSEKPVLSINRNFTAPVRLTTNHTESELVFLMGHDSDSFNRYEALQTVLLSEVKELIKANQEGKSREVSTGFTDAFLKIITDSKMDYYFKALCLEMPSADTFYQEQTVLDFENTKKALVTLTTTLAIKFEAPLLNLYQTIASEKGEYKLDPISMGKRELKDKLQALLVHLDHGNKHAKMISAEYKSAMNMTDRYNSLKNLVYADHAESQELLAHFYNEFKNDKLVMQKWMGVQASKPADSVYETVLKLEKDVVFDKTIPNFVRALFLAFGMNKYEFNHKSGRGYKLLADKILEFDAMNPQVASRLASAFKDFKRLPSDRKALMKKELERIIVNDKISKNVYEIISKTLNDV